MAAMEGKLDASEVREDVQTKAETLDKLGSRAQFNAGWQSLIV